MFSEIVRHNNKNRRYQFIYQFMKGVDKQADKSFVKKKKRRRLL